jgi:hypothetical protein
VFSHSGNQTINIAGRQAQLTTVLTPNKVPKRKQMRPVVPSPSKVCVTNEQIDNDLLLENWKYAIALNLVTN